MITSSANPKIKQIIQLQKKAALRRQQDVFVVEGTKMFAEADPAGLQMVFVSQSFLKKEEHAALLSQKCPKENSYEIVTDAVMAAMSDTKTPQGVLCVVKQLHYRLEDMLQRKAPRLMLLEDVRDPGNLGTIMRSAEAADIAGVLLTKGCVDMYNPKTIRSTMGSLYRVPFLYIEDLQLTLTKLKEHGLVVYAAALQDSVGYHTCSYTNGCVFAIGNEANGLSEEMLAMADCVLHIPMAGQVESLNAAMAASILMYEAYRQSLLESKEK